MSNFTVVSNIKRDGVVYTRGETIDLPAEEGAILLADGVVVGEGEVVPTPETAPVEETVPEQNTWEAQPDQTPATTEEVTTPEIVDGNTPKTEEVVVPPAETGEQL